MTPKECAEHFFDNFAPKKVGGGEMFQYLIRKFDRYGKIMYKKGYEAGRERKEGVYHKGRMAGRIEVFKGME